MLRNEELEKKLAKLSSKKRKGGAVDYASSNSATGDNSRSFDDQDRSFNDNSYVNAHRAETMHNNNSYVESLQREQENMHQMLMA